MHQAKVIIYTTSYCPYCTRAKKLLDTKGIHYEEIDVEHDMNKREEMLAKSDGRKTIPQIFINNKHIGGFTDLDALNQQGELDKLLKP